MSRPVPRIKIINHRAGDTDWTTRREQINSNLNDLQRLAGSLPDRIIMTGNLGPARSGCVAIIAAAKRVIAAIDD